MNQSVNVPLLAAIAAAALIVATLTIAGVVWLRRRRAAVKAAPYRITAFVFLVGSAFLFLVSLSFQLLTVREGGLRMHDLFVVRAAPERGVPRFDDRGDRLVAAGETLLSFERPGQAAEFRAMQFEFESAQNELARIRACAFDIAPKLSRETARIEAERRLLVQQRQTARSALGLTQPQIRLEILAQQARIHVASTEIERLRGRMARNRAELTYAAAVATSRHDLECEKLVAPLEVRLGERDVETLEAEAAQYGRERNKQELLQRELTSQITALRAMLDGHGRYLEQELERIDGELERLSERRAAVAEATLADLARLETLHAAEMRQHELHVAALASSLAQKRQEVCVVAPAEGRVLYLHPSPAACPAEEPILAFGRESSIRAVLRLRQAEADRIAAAGPIALRAIENVEEPRFIGSFLSMRSISSEPGLTLVELSCLPSPSVLRQLLAQSRLDFELDWSPPLYADPVFDLAVGLFACFLLLRICSCWPRRERAHRPLHTMTPATATESLDGLTR